MTKLGWAFVYAALAGVDLLLTLIGLVLGHPELNPIAAAVIATGGPVALLVYKVALADILIVLCLYHWDRLGARALAYAALIGVTLAVVNNVVVLVT